MNSQWKIQHKESLDKYKAQFPVTFQDANGHLKQHPIYEYVKISHAKGNVIVKWTARKGATGYEIYISKKVLKKLPDATDVEITASTEKEYKRYLLLNDRVTILGYIGLLLAVLGVVIDASLKIGDAGYGFISVSHMWIGILKYLYPVLTILGIILVFVKERAK